MVKTASQINFPATKSLSLHSKALLIGSNPRSFLSLLLNGNIVLNVFFSRLSLSVEDICIMAVYVSWFLVVA